MLVHWAGFKLVENIDHTWIKVRSPQTNGIVERLHRTVPNEFYRVTFRRKIYSGIESYRPTSMAGRGSTMSCARIRCAGVTARLRYKPGLTRLGWREKRYFFPETSKRRKPR